MDGWQHGDNVVGDDVLVYEILVCTSIVCASHTTKITMRFRVSLLLPHECTAARLGEFMLGNYRIK